MTTRRRRELTHPRQECTVESVGKGTARWTDSDRREETSHTNANDIVEAPTTILDRDLVNDSIGRIVTLVILTDLTECGTERLLDDAQWNAMSLREPAHPDATRTVAVIEARLKR